jgi:hypothetical protein
MVLEPEPVESVEVMSNRKLTVLDFPRREYPGDDPSAA